MHLASKQIPGTSRHLASFIVLFVSAFIVFAQPREAKAASLYGQGEARIQMVSARIVAKTTLTPKAREALINKVLSDSKIASFAERKRLLEAIRVSQTTYSRYIPTPDTTSPLNADTLFDLVNQHRTSIGLVALQKDDRLMQVASKRAPEIFDEVFVNANMHAGFYSMNLPYWATENIIYFNTEQGAITWWLNSPIHRHAIENATYTHTGIACAGKACSMIYSSFQPK